jgi:mRNA interferase RelE/StbE
MSQIRSFRFHPRVCKDLDSIQPKHHKQITTKMMNLCREPRPIDSKHLKGQPGFYRIDSGEYRTVYTFDDTEVYIRTIGPRNDDEVFERDLRRS